MKKQIPNRQGQAQEFVIGTFVFVFVTSFMNLVDYTSFSPSCCTPGMTWNTFLTLKGSEGIYLDHVGPLRHSKSYRVGWVVAHKILVTSPEAKFLFPFLGPGLWTGTWPWACQLGVTDLNILYFKFEVSVCCFLFTDFGFIFLEKESSQICLTLLLIFIITCL